MKLEIGEPYRTDPISLGWHVDIDGGEEFCCDVFSSGPGNAEKYARRIVAALENVERLAEALREILATLRAAKVELPEGRALFTREQLVKMATEALAAYEKGDA